MNHKINNSLINNQIDTLITDNDSLPVYIDMDRMKKALASPSILVPMGMSREEMRQFILTHTENLDKD